MNSNSKTHTPYLLYIFILIFLSILSISFYYIYEAILSLQRGLNYTLIYQLVLGLFGVLLSMYMLINFRKRISFIKPLKPQNIVTIVECQKCSLKNLRKFTKEDFIFKKVEDCQKCKEPMLITGIYSEKTK